MSFHSNCAHSYIFKDSTFELFGAFVQEQWNILLFLNFCFSRSTFFYGEETKIPIVKVFIAFSLRQRFSYFRDLRPKASCSALSAVGEPFVSVNMLYCRCNEVIRQLTALVAANEALP